MQAILELLKSIFTGKPSSGDATMKCPNCQTEIADEVKALKWPRVLQNTIFMIVLLVGYQLTLTLFVSRYDTDEVRNIFLLVVNIGVALVSAYLGKKGFEKFAMPVGAASGAARLARAASRATQ